MLEEAYSLRMKHVEKRRRELGLKTNDERFGIPEALPELNALLFVLEYGGEMWESDKHGVQKQMLKAVREACENGLLKKNPDLALATFAATRRCFFADAEDEETQNFGAEWEKDLSEKCTVAVDDAIKAHYPESASDAIGFAVQTYDTEIEARRKA